MRISKPAAVQLLNKGKTVHGSFFTSIEDVAEIKKQTIQLNQEIDRFVRNKKDVAVIVIET